MGQHWIRPEQDGLGAVAIDGTRMQDGIKGTASLFVDAYQVPRRLPQLPVFGAITRNVLGQQVFGDSVPNR